MRNNLNLNWLRSFEAAARHLSFTAAARETGLTQTAVSQHIKALEAQLGDMLFLRRPKSLQLTDVGKAYLITVRAALDALPAGAPCEVAALLYLQGEGDREHAPLAGERLAATLGRIDDQIAALEAWRREQLAMRDELGAAVSRIEHSVEASGSATTAERRRWRFFTRD